MNLRKFLLLNDFPIGELVRKMGVNRPHFSRIINGRRILTLKMAKRIEVATDGKLKIEDLLRISREQKKRT
jgi:plasmid maintenance system antidote protein VapI